MGRGLGFSIDDEGDCDCGGVFRLRDDLNLSSRQLKGGSRSPRHHNINILILLHPKRALKLLEPPWNILCQRNSWRVRECHSLAISGFIKLQLDPNIGERPVIGDVNDKRHRKAAVLADDALWDLDDVDLLLDVDVQEF